MMANIGDKINVDGQEYVADKGLCERCVFDRFVENCSKYQKKHKFNCKGVIFKLVESEAK